MQRYVTPHPGRTPSKGNIVNREDYKLGVQLTEFRQNQYVLTIDKFIPEYGWSTQQYFLDPEELAQIRSIIDGSK